ncbi:hypothetical protein BD309DRAFT_738806 [Dichomitus squalens]|nr:hypothetical protein BD309DRAFT_738806 [Dichomitus squalens]
MLQLSAPQLCLTSASAIRLLPSDVQMHELAERERDNKQVMVKEYRAREQASLQAGATTRVRDLSGAREQQRLERVDNFDSRGWLPVQPFLQLNPNVVVATNVLLPALSVYKTCAEEPHNPADFSRKMPVQSRVCRSQC